MKSIVCVLAGVVFCSLCVPSAFGGDQTKRSAKGKTKAKSSLYVSKFAKEELGRRSYDPIKEMERIQSILSSISAQAPSPGPTMQETTQWLLDRQLSGPNHSQFRYPATLKNCVWEQKWYIEDSDGDKEYGFIRIDFKQADPKSLTLRHKFDHMIVLTIGPMNTAVTGDRDWDLQPVDFARIKAAVTRLSELCGNKQVF